MTHLQEQVDELGLLESVFSSPGEFEIQDKASHQQAEAYLEQLTPHPPQYLSCLLCIPIKPHQHSDDEVSSDGECEASVGNVGEESYSINISVRLPPSYPHTHPEVYASANELTRHSQDELNTDLQAFIKTLPLGEACLLSVLEWTRDNAADYFPIPCTNKSEPELNVDTSSNSHFCRMWLYMHHIYSKTKRRNILSLTSELELSGFCLPGKPGVVCVEGTVRNTSEFYNTLRRWNWKSIACRKREVEPSADVGASRKVQGFEELSLDVHGHRQKHMDMGQFLTYLRAHALEYMFKELFGVEGRST